jgi:hypothetical protein
VFWIHLAVRLVAACAAIAAFYVAWFVYEDEERKLQNKIEAWWIQFDDFRSKMVSRQAAIVVVVAQRATGILDCMFGQAVLAKDSIAAAVCLNVSSVNFLAPVFVPITGGPVAPDWTRVVIAVLVFACAFAPLVSPRLRLLPRAIMWMFAVVLLLSAVLLILFLGLHLLDGESVPLPHSSFDDAVPHNLLFISITLASSAVTLFQVAIAAHAMRLTIASKSEWPIILGMAIVSLPIGIMLALAILFGKIAAGSTSITDVTASNALMIWAGSTVLSCFISTGLWLLLASPCLTFGKGGCALSD